MTRLNVDKVMAQVMAEVAHRRAADPVAFGAGESGAAKPWGGARPQLPQKTEYSLGELLEFSDEPFVRNAYLAILRRPTDPEGLSFYIGRLRKGQLTKVEVLGALRWSEEGKRKGVHVDGLLVPFVLQQWKRKPVVGPLLAWCHGLVRIGSFMGRLSSVESHQARESVELGKHINRLASQSEQHLATAMKSVDDCSETLRKSRLEITDCLRRLSDFESAASCSITTLGASLTNVGQSLERLECEMESHKQSQQELRTETESIRREVAAHGSVLGREEDQRHTQAAFQRSLDPFYVAFEQRFRGSPELIKARAAPYLDILVDAQVGDATKPVLDLGCGNGEWLELLRERGFTARGLDTNRTFIDLCHGKGLDVVEGDALEYLRAQPDGVLGAITGMHIAEHLPFETLVALLDECRRALCHGGVLALETPNPENLMVGAHYFYMDPTHRNPLPPEALRWIVEARGFHMCRIERWTIAREISAPSLLADDVPGADSVNALLSQFHIAPDYAVIGRRL